MSDVPIPDEIDRIIARAVFGHRAEKAGRGIGLNTAKAVRAALLAAGYSSAQ